MAGQRDNKPPVLVSLDDRWKKIKEDKHQEAIDRAVSELLLIQLREKRLNIKLIH